MVAGQEERPWETPGAIRRDAEPHRGLPLCCAAICSWVCAFGGLLLSCVLWHHYALALTFVVTYASGIALAIWTWSAARKDLRRIQRNEVVIHGQLLTVTARDLAKAALVMHLMMSFLAIFFISWLM
jgi:hypothetical protein